MNKKKLGIRIVVTGIVGYFLGTSVYELLKRPDNPIYNLLIGLLALSLVTLIGILYHFHVRKNYPDVVKSIATEENDERGQLIRGKTSTYTLMLVLILAIGLFAYSVIQGYEIVAYLIAISYLITVIFNLLINSHLNKKI